MDKDTRSGIAAKRDQHYNDFWSFCDTINAGKCRVVFENAFRQMYNLPSNLTVLPHMPIDGDSWSVLNSWVMSTPSFLEFVMFSRMFINALDAQHYDKHHANGTCALGTSKIDRFLFSCSPYSHSLGYRWWWGGGGLTTLLLCGRKFGRCLPRPDFPCSM